MHVVILGAPGSGKGTQSAEIVKHFALQHLSTGDMLRAEISEGSTLGLAAKTVIDNGELVSDDIIMGMVATRIKSIDTGILFDGFPRTIAQAEDLDQLLKAQHTEITQVIQLEVGNEEIIARMLARGRQDDNEDTIRNRLTVFDTQTAPLIDFYRKQNKLATVLGRGDVKTVFARIKTVLSH